MTTRSLRALVRIAAVAGALACETQPAPSSPPPVKSPAAGVPPPPVPAPRKTLTEAELSALADRVAAYTLKVPTAERSPAIQAEDDRVASEILKVHESLDPKQSIELQHRVLEKMAVPSLLKLVDGALLADDFDASDVDLRRWQILRQDPGIAVAVTGGELRVSGTSAGGMKLGPGFAGLISKTFADTAVELIARMRVVTGPPAEKGDHLAFVHLCSSQPDFFAQVEAGKRDVDSAPRYAVARRASDNEGDAIAIGTPVAWKLAEWTTVKIRHDPVRGTTDVFFEPMHGGRITALSAAPMSFTSAKIELKVLDTITGAPIDARFDDCRLYPAPAAAPLVIQALEGGHEGRAAGGLEVSVRVIGSNAPAIAASSDSMGRCAITLPDTVDYPARIRVTAKRGESIVLDAVTPEVRGVRGVYPGDVWLVRLPVGGAPEK